MTDCRFELLQDGAGGYEVRLTVDDEQPLAAPFDFDLFNERRLREVVAGLESGSVNKSGIKDIGTYLWNALRPEPIQSRINALEDRFRISLKIPDQFEINRLPWEAIYDETAKRYLACDRRRALTRVIAERGFTANEGIASGPVRMLVVVPRGSALDTSRELANLLDLPRRVGKDRLTVKPLIDRVTADDIRDAVREPWDIMHFIGHSRFKPETGVEIRLNAGDDSLKDEHWPDANQFAELLAGSNIRLAVFNSCESDRSVSSNFSGLGQQVSVVAGIPAVVVMRYRIDDSAAIRFSSEFYRELFNPGHPGRVDIAMQEARHWLYTNARDDEVKSFITPVLHLAPGSSQVFPEARIAALADAAPSAETAAPERKIDLPPDLVDRLRRGICVPVIGPGIYPPASRLGEEHAPTLLKILDALAEAYPDRNELMVAESVAEFTSVFFPRVFQHFESANDREKLIMTLQTCYAATQMPGVLRRIATWRVPGIVYAQIDGMMEEALRAAGRSPQVVNIADRARAAAAETRDDSVLTLFNLRGTLTDAESLILTDTDHDVLLHSRLEHANPDVANLFKKTLGRSVLFIGVSPVDPAVRRLARLYLEAPRKVQGPRYFVVPHASAGDKAYWKDLDVRWIEADPALVVETIDAAMKEA